ncbi:hypothetical protein ACISSW_26660, partial [Escherichia coli]
MNIYTFDFDEIESQEDFYRDFSQAFGLAKEKVRDLDPFWDVLMKNVLPPPLEIELLPRGGKRAPALGGLFFFFDGGREGWRGFGFYWFVFWEK